jgi:uncharacterized RDD family membrane protein YckC
MYHPALAPSSAPQLREPAASAGRRLLASLIDLVLAVALVQPLFAFASIFSPPETVFGMLPGLLLGFVVGMGYFAFAAAIFGNTVGKWLLGIRIANLDGNSVHAGAWVLRAVVLAFTWPICAVLLLVGDGRHWADRAGDTRVVRDRPMRPVWLGLVALLLLFAVVTRLGVVSLRLAVARTEVLQVTRTQVVHDHPNASVPMLPQAFHIINDYAVFDFAVDGRYERVAARRIEGHWLVTEMEPTDAPLDGVAISFGE